MRVSHFFPPTEELLLALSAASEPVIHYGYGASQLLERRLGQTKKLLLGKLSHLGAQLTADAVGWRPRGKPQTLADVQAASLHTP